MQCGRCGDHRRENIIVDGKRGKRWKIERCVRTECHFNFEIEEYDGRAVEAEIDAVLKKPRGNNWTPDGKWYS